MSESIDIANVVHGIRRRARFSRGTGLTIIVVLTLIGVATVAAFLITGSAGGFNYVSFAPNFISGENTHASIQIGGETNMSGALDWIVEITKSFIRVASVIMSVFLINILVSFARYNLRVANYLDARADCLAITMGETDKFAALLPSISVDPLDFGKTPMNPYDTYLEAIRGIMPGRFKTSAPESERKPHREAKGDTA